MFTSKNIVLVLLTAFIIVFALWITHKPPVIVEAAQASYTPCTISHGIYDCTDATTSQKLLQTAKEGIQWYDTDGKVTIKNDGLKFLATVTAYSSRKQETDGSPEVGATGQNIYKLYLKHDNTCASNDYSFGTVILVPGVGTCTVRDRMNQRYNGKGHIDFYMGYNTKQALQFGSKQMEVVIKE